MEDAATPPTQGDFLCSSLLLLLLLVLRVSSSCLEPQAWAWVPRRQRR
jgi:hypothetical protein